MQKLGINISPTSVTWALVRTNDDGSKSLVKSGIRQFKDGVEHTTKGEVPATQTRTENRSLRKIHRRKRSRKADLLLVLTRNGLCPAVPEQDIRTWKQKKRFPFSPELSAWLSVNAAENRNPYSDRHECLHRKLDLSLQPDRYILGRAMYHLAQRRGYLAGKDDTDSKETGTVLKAIAELTSNMKEAGTEYLGDYFYTIMGEKRIRSRYLSRKEHVEAEFERICEVQGLTTELHDALYRAMFRQAPLKSQKWAVGKCIFERNKPRCKTSHPDFEEYRMWSTLNNFKLKSNGEKEFRPFTDEEKQSVMHLFFRKSKPSFDFVEVASVIAGVKIKAKDAVGRTAGALEFNYRLDQNIAGCPVTAAIITALGKECTPDNWRETLKESYTRKDKTKEETVNDLWHALEFYDDKDMLTDWLSANFGLEQKAAGTLAEYRLPADYSAMSLKAVRSCVPFLKRGFRTHEAIYLASVEKCLPETVTTDKERMKDILDNVAVLLDDYANLPQGMRPKGGIEAQIKDYIRGLDAAAEPDRLWTPSSLETFVPVYDSNVGKMKLPSPITSSMKNPLVMRCLVQTGQIVNALISEGLVDRNTAVSFGMNDEINTRNARAAIYQFQADNRKRRDEIMKRLEEEGVEVNESNILRYRLWDEQNHIDILSGDEIGLASVFDTDAVKVVSIIPLGMGGNETAQNQILVKRKSAEKKERKLVSEAFDPSDIEANMAAAGWFETIERYERFVLSNTKSSKSAQTKDAKDRAIKQRHLNGIILNYWKGKAARMTTDIPFDDSESILHGRYGAIGKYLTAYLKSVFRDVYSVGNDSIAEFRKIWGIPRNGGGYDDLLKSAVTTACIDKEHKDAYNRHMRNIEYNRMYGKPFEPFPLPWPEFVRDINNEAATVLTSSWKNNNLNKDAKYKVRNGSGHLMKDAEGHQLFGKGMGARGALHRDTFLGMVNLNGEMTPVIRVPAESIEEKDLEKIINPDVREIFRNAIEEYGSIKEAMKDGGLGVNHAGFPIRHVRVRSYFKEPIILKKHPEKSRQEYKRNIYVINEDNDVMIIHNDDGEKSFDIFSNLEASRFFRKNGKEIQGTKSSDRVIRKGTCVLFYKDNRDELKELSRAELSRRLYKVVGLGKQMTFRHHLDIKSKPESGFWNPGGKSLLAFKMNYNKYGFAVEGTDFTISRTGEIEFLL